MRAGAARLSVGQAAFLCVRMLLATGARGDLLETVAVALIVALPLIALTTMLWGAR